MKDRFDKLARRFNDLRCQRKVNDEDALNEIGRISAEAVSILQMGAQLSKQGTMGDKEYYVFRTSNPEMLSRPVRMDLFIFSAKSFLKSWNHLLSAMDSKRGVIDYPDVDPVLYTAAQAFACVYDLYQPASRKTPGTFFEMLIGALLSLTTGLKRRKQIAIPKYGYKVPTDIVLTSSNGTSLVIPTKITTRDRIVQAWAHQRILDDVYKGKYKSILVSVSELQRDGKRGVNEICLPNQIGLFQAHLSKLSGMYYADPPLAYVTANFEDLPVRTLGQLFQKDLTNLLSR